MKIFLITLCFITGIVNASEIVSNKYIIDSDTQLLLSNGNVKAVGHVHAVSGDLTVDADEAIYHRENPNHAYLIATGNPINYKGITEDGKPFSGNSKKLKYTPETGEVILTDEAVVQQSENMISAEIITYNINTKKITASSTRGNRVKSIIYPDNLSHKNK